MSLLVECTVDSSDVKMVQHAAYDLQCCELTRGCDGEPNDVPHGNAEPIRALACMTATSSHAPEPPIKNTATSMTS